MIRSPLSLALALVAGGSVAGAAEFSPGSRVTEVTVYRDGALVTREARVTLPPGDHRILLKEIPSVADPNSVRVAGTGTGGVSIGGVEVSPEFRPPNLSPEYKALEKEIADLNQELGALDDRQKSLGTLREFLNGLKASAGQESSKDLLTRGFAVDSWQKAFQFLSERLNGIAAEERGMAPKRKDLSERIQVVQQKLAQVASQGGIQRLTASVLVSAPRGGEMTLRATYLASGASWAPLYDARLDPAKGKVEVIWQAQIAQNSGEDWKDVAVTLSTTRPAAGIDLPKLTSVWLRIPTPAEMQRAGAKSEGGFVSGLPVLGKDYQDVLTLQPGVTDASKGGGGVVNNEAPLPAPMPVAEGGVERRDVSVTFSLPGRQDIPSDAQPHKHRIASREMDSKIEYRTVPRVVPAVYLVARLTLSGDVPLLPGRVQHFVGPDLVGSSWMMDRSVGEEFPLSFGPDDRLKVDRKLIQRKVDQKGKDDETDYRFLTTLENHLGREAVLELKDRIPVSGDERITVTLDERETTPGTTTDPNEPGILTWKITVPPGGKKEMTLRYRVRAPRGLPLSGLD